MCDKEEHAVENKSKEPADDMFVCFIVLVIFKNKTQNNSFSTVFSEHCCDDISNQLTKFKAICFVTIFKFNIFKKSSKKF